MAKFNVLIFPCGAENALEIYEALRFHVDVWVMGASSVPNHGVYAYENYDSTLPNISAPDFIDKLNMLIKQYEIKYIFPTHDTVSLYMAEQSATINAVIVGSPIQTSQICRSKKKTYEFFEKAGFLPQLYSAASGDLIRYPVFVKPDIGEGGKNTRLVKDEEDLGEAVKKIPDPVIAEYLSGTELTVDCFTDQYGKLRFIGPRSRERINMGISFHSEVYPLTEEISGIGEAINNKLSFRGLWFFQLRADTQGKFKLLEISVRAAGTMALYRQLGINFPVLSLFDAAGYDVDLIRNEHFVSLDRCLYSRFKHQVAYSVVYIDFDDTIIVHNAVNPTAIRFLYQCKKNRKKVILITRHGKELATTLNDFAIHEKLFDEVIHIGFDARKEDFIGKDDAIFIDNSFAERKAVKVKRGIPVFDVDAIHSLIEN